MPILPAQLNYCVERPREISGIDIESVAVGTRAAHRNGKRADEGEDREHGWPTKKRERDRDAEREAEREKERRRQEERFLTRMDLPGTKGRFRGITFNKFCYPVELTEISRPSARDDSRQAIPNDKIAI